MTGTNMLAVHGGGSAATGLEARRARFVVLGGFLGAGKTVAGAKLASWLAGQGLRAGLIMNDHGTELVDTAALRALGCAAEEVGGGCFSSRLEALTEAARRLGASGSAPDVIIAEPAGNCADLRTVAARGEHDAAGLVSVLVDAPRAEQWLDGAPGGKFSNQQTALWRRQARAADFLVISKCDAVERSRAQQLKATLEKQFQPAGIFEISSRTGAGLEEWFAALMQSRAAGRTQAEPPPDIADAPPIGWLNCTVRLSSVKYFEARRVTLDLAMFLQTRLRHEGAEVAHLKMSFTPDEEIGGSEVVSLVGSDRAPELSLLARAVPEPVQNGLLILNLRAEAAPEMLNEAVNQALMEIMEKSPELFARMEHSEHFRAGQSEPRAAGREPLAKTRAAA